MNTIVHTGILHAMEADIVQVESTFARGFTGIQLIGNNTEVCRQGLARVQAALESVGIKIPEKKIIISSYPADIKKDGAQFDLPTAMSLLQLICTKEFEVDTSRWLFAAELGLNGELRPVRGIATFTVMSMVHKLDGIVVAYDNFYESKAMAKLGFNSTQVKGFKHLNDVICWLNNDNYCDRVGDGSDPSEDKLSLERPEFSDMVLSRDLETLALVVAVGNHNLFLSGTPGSGKSMFSERLPSIMPLLGVEQRIEVLKIHSVFYKNIPVHILQGERPFRAPHHQASCAAVLGTPEHPGEIALAHGGILFLDEFPEFRRDVLEGLREPLELGRIQVSRANKKAEWKGDVVLIAASNNCPCGWLGSKQRLCNCPISKIQSYRRKMSGPLMDRFDLHLNLSSSCLDKAELFKTLSRIDENKKKFLTLQERVKKSQGFSLARNKKFGIRFNCAIPAKHMIAVSKLSERHFSCLITASTKGLLTNRSLVKILRVARTLTDLDMREVIEKKDIEQAMTWSQEACAYERGDYAYGTA